MIAGPQTYGTWRSRNRSTEPTGSKASSMSSVTPDVSAADSSVIPPMWVNGVVVAAMSPGPYPVLTPRPVPAAMTDRSPWRAPFGSAVVPEV